MFNVVKFRVKPGQDEAFLDAHRYDKARWPGLTRGVIIKTGDQTYCLVGEWEDANAIANARSRMIETLDRFRATLESLGDGPGVSPTPFPVQWC
jgi:quinol monooxygenase YgiN